MSELGLFSTAGERLATTLISGICRDVDNRSITPYQAMDRLSDAFERISVLDNGISDTDVLNRIIDHVNKHFLKARFIPLEVDEMVAYAEKWQRKGAPVALTAMPLKIARMASTSHIVISSFNALSAHTDITVGISNCPPWNPDFRKNSAVKADFALYIREAMSETYAEKMPSIGCVILGEEASDYLDIMLSDLSLEGQDIVLERIIDVIGKEPVDKKTMMSDLIRLDNAIREFNLTSNRLNTPERVGVKLISGTQSASISVTWDGITIPPEAEKMLLRKTQPQNTFEYTPLPQEMFLVDEEMIAEETEGGLTFKS
jgi:hypothetical protein